VKTETIVDSRAHANRTSPRPLDALAASVAATDASTCRARPGGSSRPAHRMPAETPSRWCWRRQLPTVCRTHYDAARSARRSQARERTRRQGFRSFVFGDEPSWDGDLCRTCSGPRTQRARRPTAPASLVRARGREWIVLSEVTPTPCGCGRSPAPRRTRPSSMWSRAGAGARGPLPPARAPTARPVTTLRCCCATRCSCRCGAGAGPFRSFGQIAVEPRAYQLVPLLMALKLDPVRLLIADDVGIGKTIEAGLIARELLDRGEIERTAVLCPPHLVDQWVSELGGPLSPPGRSPSRRPARARSSVTCRRAEPLHRCTPTRSSASTTSRARPAARSSCAHAPSS
jgi:hypothetical protein